MRPPICPSAWLRSRGLGEEDSPAQISRPRWLRTESSRGRGKGHEGIEGRGRNYPEYEAGAPSALVAVWTTAVAAMTARAAAAVLAATSVSLVAEEGEAVVAAAEAAERSTRPPLLEFGERLLRPLP